MVFFNYSTMQMAAKVVFYGPGLCGKTTNLQYIYGHTSNDSRGEMVSLETETDRTLFFDLLPIDVGQIGGFNTRIQLYTVPGQVFYNTTRKLVLKGVDGVVFVADSQRPMLQANIESFRNLEENLAEAGLSLEELPLVIQFNKRDLPDICTIEELNQALNRQNWPWFEASAIKGVGVFETLKGISKLTLLTLKKRLAKGAEAGRPGPRPMPRPNPSSVTPGGAPQGPAVPAAIAAAASAAAVVAANAAHAASAAHASNTASAAAAQAPADPQASPSGGPPANPATAPSTQSPPRPPMPGGTGGAPSYRPAPIGPPTTTQSGPGTVAVPPRPLAPTAQPTLPTTPTPPPAGPASQQRPYPPPPNFASPSAPPPNPAAAPRPAALAAPAAVTPAPAIKRAREVDVLGELERIRKQALKPLATPPRPTTLTPAPMPVQAAPAPPNQPTHQPQPVPQPKQAAPTVPATANGQHEISRDLEIWLRREDLPRAQRFAISFQVLDANHRVVETRNLDIDVANPDWQRKLLVHLNVAVHPAE